MPAPIGSDYSLNQLQRALDAAARGEPVQEKLRRWRAVVDGLLSGKLAVGNRKPVDGYPEWVTLEVATGGFATGVALAAGPLLPHEVALLDELGLSDTASPRLALNRYFLSDAGLDRLRNAVSSRQVVIDTPEEAALPVVAWLVANGYADLAGELIAVLAPLAHELRFYPRIDTAQAEPVDDARVHLESVGQVVKRLRDIRPKRQVLAQRNAVGVWIPLYDAAVDLVLETVEGTLPVALKDEQGKWLHDEHGRMVLQGGWPFKQVPTDWPARVQALIADVARARSQHAASRRFSAAGEPFVVLMDALALAVKDPAQLTGQQVARVRLIVARYMAVRGTPDSATAQTQRARQRGHATAQTHQQLAVTVANRLASYAPSAGLDDVDAVLQVVNLADVPDVPTTHNVPATHNVLNTSSTQASAQHPLRTPAEIKARQSMLRRLRRCVLDSPEGLIQRGVVTSAEVLARLLPQRTSQLRAASFDDDYLRMLYAAIYQAFRRRRSLLLLDLQKQVQIHELPWVAALNLFRDTNATAAQTAGTALDEFAFLALSQFPQTALPNKLLQEFVALADEAGRQLPFTEELAADIFMGRFSPKFVAATQLAAKHLGDSLYARYYRIDYHDMARRLSAADTGSAGEMLAALCADRAGEQLGSWRAVSNGRIIEQQLVITSHNLALLLELPGVRERLTTGADELARKCFAWVLRHLQLTGGGHHVERHRRKNAAYAWRQMVFLLSLQTKPLDAFLAYADTLLSAQPKDFVRGFYPISLGLHMAVESPEIWHTSRELMPFLGWQHSLPQVHTAG
ncbi:hypothetical protein FXN63_07435 [Pigmentiphaga aceris]|uniref:Uncharacterized protein n=1 Tax=Pigmentiphaga aceris TaxID=1940612 RepID=A0A5C0ATN4_9BURK|nr:hypothetical protein [Pigmentiphaga aceris]QEI05692.1 hypothetical protein FXN63_07435 [Pigmentiphaga aceris]